MSINSFVSSLIPSGSPQWLATSIYISVLLVVCCIAYFISVYFLRLLGKIASRTPTDWDDALLNRKMRRAISFLAPAVAANWLLGSLFAGMPRTFNFLNTAFSFYILWAVVHILAVLVDNIYDTLLKHPRERAYAVKGFFQMLKIIFIGVGVIIGLSMLIGKTPMTILTALGASAAVLSLVFKDTILGFVASIQLTANKMLHRGDWIIVPGTDANGEVIDISLTTVKVRNWDNSVTTVPPYNLISGSFCNFQNMRRMGRRRVAHAIYIDMDGVRLLDEGEIKALAEAGLVDAGRESNSRVNLGLLRRYLEKMISSHPEVDSKSLLMVRQLDPTPAGLPLQMYFFVKETRWMEYEHISDDIMNEVYAAVPRFGLRIFQQPSGRDLRSFTDAAEIKRIP